MEYSNIILDKIEKIKIEYDEITKLLSYNEIQSDVLYFRNLVKRRNEIENISLMYKEFYDTKNQIVQIQNQIKNEKDEELLQIEKDDLKIITNRLNSLYIKMKFMLLGKTKTTIILEIITQNKQILDWATRMYVNYCEINELKYCIECLKNDFVSLKINGNMAYERLSIESGNHIVKNSDGSQAMFKIQCYNYMDNCNIELKDRDIKIDLFRSSGAGGQNINKLETAVRITHLETGISVVCQDERSQRQNKEKALKNLKAKLIDYYNTLNNENINKEKKINQNIIVRTYDFVQNKVYDKTYSENLNQVLQGNLNVFVDDILIKE